MVIDLMTEEYGPGQAIGAIAPAGLDRRRMLQLLGPLDAGKRQLVKGYRGWSGMASWATSIAAWPSCTQATTSWTSALNASRSGRIGSRWRRLATT